MQRKVEDMDTKNLPIGREPMMMMMMIKLPDQIIKVLERLM